MRMPTAATLPGTRTIVANVAAQPATARTIVRRTTGWQLVDLRELWRYRELLWILCQRDIKVRYKQTALGVAWAIIQPVTTMVVFSLFFRWPSK